MPRRKKRKQDATPMVCSRCGNSGEVTSRKLSEQVSSKLSSSLVSLASFNGDKMLRTCTGICIKSLNANTMSVMTSLTLVPYHDDKIKLSDISKIEVKLPNGQVVEGKLGSYDRYSSIAIVNIKNVPANFHAEYLSLDHDMPLEPDSEVVAAWRCHNTGEFKTTMGTLIDIPESQNCIFFSTCKIGMAGLGGVLVDYDGNFIGMNNFHANITEQLFNEQKYTSCLPQHEILEWLGSLGMLNIGIEQEGGDGKAGSNTSETRSDLLLLLGVDYMEYVNKMSSHCYGYPLPALGQACENMHLKYTFEEEFGGDISSSLGKGVGFKVSETVVSFASFNGKTRFFACTGLFVGGSAHSAKILTSASLVTKSGIYNRNMRIEVRLPNGHRVKGILRYCNLCYNIAFVDIMGSFSPHTIKFQTHIPVSNETGLVAVGCLFDQRTLMATKGALIDNRKTDKHCQFDCKELCFSDCKITKAGIGGPLVDMCGNFVGMNFYDETCTPFLPGNIIRGLLKDDFLKDICVKCLNDEPVVVAGVNRWPLLEPCWSDPPPPTVYGPSHLGPIHHY